jgi:hypothetical protein
VSLPGRPCREGFAALPKEAPPFLAPRSHVKGPSCDFHPPGRIHICPRASCVHCGAAVEWRETVEGMRTFDKGTERAHWCASVTCRDHGGAVGWKETRRGWLPHDADGRLHSCPQGKARRLPEWKAAHRQAVDNCGVGEKQGGAP